MTDGTEDETFYLRLPYSMEIELIELASRQGLSVEDIVTDAVIEKLTSARRFIGPIETKKRAKLRRAIHRPKCRYN